MKASRDDAEHAHMQIDVRLLHSSIWLPEFLTKWLKVRRLEKEQADWGVRSPHISHKMQHKS